MNNKSAIPHYSQKVNLCMGNCNLIFDHCNLIFDHCNLEFV